MKKILFSFVVTCCLVLVLASFAEVFAAPVADAGPDQVVFDEVTLDGSGSSGEIVTYKWLLIHNENPALNRTRWVTSPVVDVIDLDPGFYSVILTVTDSLGSESSDVMSLAAAGVYASAPSPRINTVMPDPPVLEIGDPITLNGENFGIFQEGDSFVQIANKTLDIVSWDENVIVATIPSYACRKFDGAPSIDVKIYVTVGSIASNKRIITINAPLDCTTTP